MHAYVCVCVCHCVCKCVTVKKREGGRKVHINLDGYELHKQVCHWRLFLTFYILKPNFEIDFDWTQQLCILFSTSDFALYNLSHHFIFWNQILRLILTELSCYAFCFPLLLILQIQPLSLSLSHVLRTHAHKHAHTRTHTCAHTHTHTQSVLSWNMLNQITKCRFF